MAELIVTTRDGRELALRGEAGVSIMELLRNAGVDEVLALCGGCCACATCHVYVDADPALLSPMEGAEDELLASSSHRTARSRLACQLPWDDRLAGLRITVAPED